ITLTEKNKFMEYLTTSTDYLNLENVQIILECVNESLRNKHFVQKKVDDLNKIFATNTSSISVSSIGMHSKNKKKIIGMHFFRDVYKTKLVENIKTNQTSESTINFVCQFAIQLNKIPIIVKDRPGFLTTRMLAGIYQ